MTNHEYLWLNDEKKRFYKIIVKHDQNNHFSLFHQWGSSVTCRGGKKTVECETAEGTEQLIKKMMQRRKTRGYMLVN